MTAGELERPLTESETEDLAAFLRSVPAAMSLHRADGFIAGVVSVPGSLMPSQWVPKLLGGHEFTSVEEASRNFTLLMRMHNQIINDLSAEREVRPAASLSDEEVREWCRGYLEACESDPVWRADATAHTALLPFGVIAGEFDLVGERNGSGEIITDASEYEQMYRRTLPSRVVDLYQYWIERRYHGYGTVENTEKVGRNEPCPCGSGVKYKRCCGRTMSQSE